MPKINKETIHKLTQLSRIDCTKEEQEALSHDLEKILAYVDLLHEVNTDEVQPLEYILEDVHNVFQKDEVGPTLNRELVLENSPSHLGGMIRTPPVLKRKP